MFSVSSATNRRLHAAETRGQHRKLMSDAEGVGGLYRELSFGVEQIGGWH
jgi:hypothetical protein